MSETNDNQAQPLDAVANVPVAQPVTDPAAGLGTDPTAVAQESQKRGFLTGRVLAWSFWDWGSAAFNAVVVTFVFGVYLVKPHLFGPKAEFYYSVMTAVAGVVIALVAPAIGQWTDRTGKRRLILNGATVALVVIMALLFLVKPGLLWLGLALIAIGNILFEIAEVVYNSMVGEMARPGTVGRVSGFGWGMGYVGGIVLLVVIYFGLIAPDVGWFGVTDKDGMDVRVAMILCAAWMLIFAIPIMIIARDGEPRENTSNGIVGAYRELIRSIKRLWKSDRSIVWFLISAAIYRDGLAGVFTFGGILAGNAFGFDEGEVIIFAIAANVVAGISTIIFGLLDDFWGARKVIISSLILMLVAAMVIFFFHTGGKPIFWIFGLLLCVFVGPVQSASRSYLSRIIPPGQEAEIFGLYATCGRAVSFLAPAMYAAMLSLGVTIMGLPEDQSDKASYWGIIGIALVLLAGLLAFLPVGRASRTDE